VLIWEKMKPMGQIRGSRARWSGAGGVQALLLVVAVAGVPTPAIAAEPTTAARVAPADGSDAAKSPTVEVPAGEFWMGCNEASDAQCADPEKPGRKVVVGAYRIDRTEVTVARYHGCVAAGACTPAAVAPECNADAVGMAAHPINCVDWQQATTFCAWAGQRLPTEAEWEKAARGTDGRKFPWGNTDLPAAGKVANICDVACDLQWKLADYADGFAATAPVGTYPAGASPYGAADMGGNVWEWTADAYGDTPARVIRGGSWNNQARNARTSMRSGFTASALAPTVGFRCVSVPDLPETGGAK